MTNGAAASKKRTAPLWDVGPHEPVCGRLWPEKGRPNALPPISPKPEAAPVRILFRASKILRLLLAVTGAPEIRVCEATNFADTMPPRSTEAATSKILNRLWYRQSQLMALKSRLM